MASYVVVTGGGSYSIGDTIYPDGRHLCEDQDVLAAVEADDSTDWVHVEHDDDEDVVPTPDEPEPTPVVEPEVPVTEQPESALPTPAEAEVAEVESEHVVEPEPEPEGFPCPSDDCDRVFVNEGGRASHVRSKHPDIGSENS